MKTWRSPKKNCQTVNNKTLEVNPLAHNKKVASLAFAREWPLSLRFWNTSSSISSFALRDWNHIIFLSHHPKLNTRQSKKPTRAIRENDMQIIIWEEHTSIFKSFSSLSTLGALILGKSQIRNICYYKYLLIKKGRWCKEIAKSRNSIQRMKMCSKQIPPKSKIDAANRRNKAELSILVDPIRIKMKVLLLLNKRSQTRKNNHLPKEKAGSPNSALVWLFSSPSSSTPSSMWSNASNLVSGASHNSSCPNLSPQ